MMRNRFAAAVLILGVVLGLGFRVVAISVKQSLTHDDGISYLAATGHQAEYKTTCLNGDPPVAQWVPAAEWKRFVQPGDFLCFQRIGHDLAHYDFHPPLYFWLLHIWITIVGVHLWSGPVLNLLLLLLMVGLLYRFAVLALGNSLEASVVVFLFAISPYVLQSTLEARQYDLLAVLSLLMAWLTIALTNNERVVTGKKLAGLLFLVLCGALTHYYFAFVVLGCSALAVVKLLRSNIKRLLCIHATLATAYGLFMLVHREFLYSFRLQRTAADAFEWGGVPGRLVAVAASVSQFVVHQRVGEVGLVVVWAMIVAAVVFVVRRKRKVSSDPEAGNPGMVGDILYFLVWNFGIVSLAYVLHFSPGHAMGSKYLVTVWPFLAFVPVMASRGLRRRIRDSILLLLCVWQLAYGTAYALVSVVRVSRGESPVSILADAENVLCDSLARGVFPRVFWLVPDSTMVFAAKQPVLLEKEAAWLSELKIGSVYVSNLDYSNSQEAQTLVVSRIEKRYEVVDLPAGMFAYNFYALTGPKTGALFQMQGTVVTDSIGPEDSHLLPRAK